MSRLKKNVCLQEITDGGIDELLNMPPEKQREFAERAKIVFDQFNLIRRKNIEKVNSAALLPCSKEEIKTAIKIILLPHIAKNSEVNIKYLISYYTSIGRFQEFGEKEINHTIKFKKKNKTEASKDMNNEYFLKQKYFNIALKEQSELLREIYMYVGDIQKRLKKA
jgi:hypothetical protein